jgi:hypothetical protein
MSVVFGGSSFCPPHHSTPPCMGFMSPIRPHSTNFNCHGALADIVSSLVSQFTRHYILHHTSLNNVSSHVQSTRHSNLNYPTTISIFSSTRIILPYHSLLDTSMVLTRSRSQQANQNGSGQRNTDKELKPSPNTNGNGNGHDTRNHHLHPSLQHPTKSQEQETTAHHHPSFQPYCKHSDADGDLHSHALGTFT